MTMPIICEGRPGAGSYDETGYHFDRNWTVIAASEVNAMKKLNSVLGLDIGVVYKNSQGQIPDVSVRLQRFTRIEGKPPAVKGGTGLYYIEAQYGTYQLPQQPVPGGPAIWTVRPSLTSAPADHDASGVLIANSSDEPFDPPLTKLRLGEVLHGEFYVQASDSITAYLPFRPYAASVNLSPFFGAAKGCMLCHPFLCDPSTSGWIHTSVDFEYRPPKIIGKDTYEGWTDTPADMGRRTKNAKAAAGKVYQPILESDDQGIRRPAQEPHFLDGAGQELVQGKPTVVRPIKHYPYMDFNKVPGMRLK